MADKEPFINVLSAVPYEQLHQKDQVSYNGWWEAVVALFVPQSQHFPFFLMENSTKTHIHGVYLKKQVLKN